MEWLGALIIFAILVFLWRKTTRVYARVLEVGESAPDFSLPDQSGKIHTLADYSGKWLALYFYPKDDTPGCTKQACAFRDDLDNITALDAAVVGISVDDTDSHASFANKFNLQFPLLADNTGEITRRYHSLINLGVVQAAKRNTFLIDPQGKIAKTYFSANPSRNATDVIHDLNELRQAAK